MKNRKTEFRFFTIAQYQKEEDYLREKHNKGWSFSHLTFPGFYHFERCTPEDVVYQLDYNQNGSIHKREYLQIFQDCGWEYLIDFMGYSYFRKPVSEMQGEEEHIFCDDESKMEMIERVIKGRMLPLVIIFFCVIIPQLLLQSRLTHPLNQTIFVIYIFLFLLYVVLFIQFAIHYMQLKKHIQG